MREVYIAIHRFRQGAEKGLENTSLYDTLPVLLDYDLSIFSKDNERIYHSVLQKVMETVICIFGPSWSKIPLMASEPTYSSRTPQYITNTIITIAIQEYYSLPPPP